MPTVERSALVPYTAQQMYQLVNDVESYPDFLPWCSGAAVLEEEVSVRVARVDISRGPIKQHFVTRNELRDGEEIKLNLVEGPFSDLQGQWQFAAIGDSGCRVTFSTQFIFKSVLMEKTIGPVFNDICAKLVDSFVTRAKQVYN